MHQAPVRACVQVLLSQVHRLRALVLLGRFLDMGRWAVDLALSVGIFPYVLKLLQTTAPDLRQTLVFIWTKILALDRSCQVGPRGAFAADHPCRPFPYHVTRTLKVLSPPPLPCSTRIVWPRLVCAVTSSRLWSLTPPPVFQG